MQKSDKERYDIVFEQMHPTTRRGSAVTYEPDRPTTLAEYKAKYPNLKPVEIFYHFDEKPLTVNQVATLVGYNVPDFKRDTLKDTKSSKSPRSHVRGRLERLVNMGLLEKDNNKEPVVYQLTNDGQKTRKAIVAKLKADAD